MYLALFLLVLALPAAFVLLSRKLMRQRQKLWSGLSLTLVVLVWAVAAYLWVDYSRQQDDVGLIVQGIMAFAVTTSALLATAARILAARF